MTIETVTKYRPGAQPFASQRFIDSRTGEIVTQVPLSQIRYFSEYAGRAVEGETDNDARATLAALDTID